MGPARRRRRTAPVVVLGLVLVAYYLVPVREPAAETGTLLRAVGTAAVLAAAAWFVAREVLRDAHADAAAVRLDRLLVALVVGIVVSALADYLVATGGEGQIVGLRTRTDALYFALATLATVGYGDVHAAGQLARLVVSVQMLFNAAVLAAAVQIFWRVVVTRRTDGG